jgi:hypothetical protein
MNTETLSTVSYCSAVSSIWASTRGASQAPPICSLPESSIMASLSTMLPPSTTSPQSRVYSMPCLQAQIPRPRTRRLRLRPNKCTQCTVLPHIMASVFINDDESGLHHDYEVWLERLAPHVHIDQAGLEVGCTTAPAKPACGKPLS